MKAKTIILGHHKDRMESKVTAPCIFCDQKVYLASGVYASDHSKTLHPPLNYDVVVGIECIVDIAYQLKDFMRSGRYEMPKE